MLRPWRSTSGAVAILVFWALGVVGAMATAGASELPILVTGTHECGRPMPGFQTFVDEDGTESFRGRFGTCTDEMSDPIVSGIWRRTLNAQCASPSDIYPGADCVFWGGQLLDNPDSGWDCTFTGFDDPSGRNWGVVHGVCAGYGGYEGLNYVFRRAIEGERDLGDGASVHGIVYEGPSPGEEWPLRIAE